MDGELRALPWSRLKLRTMIETLEGLKKATTFSVLKETPCFTLTVYTYP